MFELFTPAKLGQHRLFFTCGWTFVIFSVFWYMIGAFPYYEAVQFPDPQRSACLEANSRTSAAYGSSQLVHWINQVPVTLHAEALSTLCLASSRSCVRGDLCSRFHRNTTSIQVLSRRATSQGPILKGVAWAPQEDLKHLHHGSVSKCSWRAMTQL